MDKIIIEDLEVYAHHGVAPEEKVNGQMFIVSLEIAADLEKAALSDNLEDTMSYAEICTDVRRVLQSAKYNLIEAAAMKIIECIFGKYNKVQVVKVLLKKPWAPMGHHLRFAGVELERRRGDRNEW